MTGPLEHVHLKANGVELHIAHQGAGPLVVMCHGYPGLWFSWRHQLKALADAGFTAAAIDMRGYGGSSRPREVNAYGYDKLSADVLSVLDYFGYEQAALIGHDFGANLAWHMAVYYPSRVRAVVALCVPYDMDLAGGGDVPPSQLYAAIAEQHFFHMHYFQKECVAERHCLGREREFLTKLFWALSAEGKLLDWQNFPSEGTHYIDVLEEPPEQLPWSWLSVEDMNYYVAQYLAAGPDLTFIGGANAYRVMDYNWHLQRSRAHAKVTVPALFVGGQEDPVTSMAGSAAFEHMRARVEDLRGVELLAGAGHFVQQEKPEPLNSLLIEFLGGLQSCP